MGATDFNTLALGRDEAEAYIIAKSEARHAYGHEGYTGSIAEKGAYISYVCPKRVTTTKLASWVTGHESYVPTEHRALVARMQSFFNDKWAPAICIVPGPTEQWRLR